jgi:cell division protein ZapA (FtsZ GTPase activity inhibitor)
MAANELHLDILGTSFSITADEDESYLREILAQYRAFIEHTTQISGMKDPLKIAVLSGFLLCDEINKMRRDSGEAEERTRDLIARIDQVLEDNPSDDG